MSEDSYGRPPSAWQSIMTAPADHDLEVAVIDGGDPVAVVFPCRRDDNGGWTNARTGRIVDLMPTHWRPWRGA